MLGPRHQTLCCKIVSKVAPTQQLHTASGCWEGPSSILGEGTDQSTLSHTQAQAVGQMAHLPFAHLTPAALPTEHSVTQVSSVWNLFPPPVNTSDKTGQIAQPPRTGSATRHSRLCWIRPSLNTCPQPQGASKLMSFARNLRVLLFTCN